MAIRFHLFEKLMLPSLASQTDQNFTLLVTVSEDMPEMYQTRLDTLAQTYAFVRLNRTSEQAYDRLIHPFMLQTTAEGTIPSAHFRLDDDDALPATYISRLRRDADRVDPGGVICYPKGIVGYLDGTRPLHGFRTISYHGLGLARVAGPGMLRSPIQMQHRSVGEHAPSYVDPTFVGFHFTLHGVNNTKGYTTAVHQSGVDHRFSVRMQKLNPELAEGRDAPTRCDEAIAASFPFADGPTIRALLQETADPVRLCDSYGFPLP